MANVKDVSLILSDHDIAMVRAHGEITGQNTTLSDIDAERNTISFIHRLPSETIEDIFIIGACEYFRKDIGFPIQTPPSWVNVSYVCRHWRNIALGYPTLWSYLFVVSPRWTEELLSRSKQAPLKLPMTMDYPPKSDLLLRFLEQVLNHVERIQEFCFCPPFLPENHQVFSRLFSHAPLLQDLILRMVHIPADHPSTSSIPRNANTPALRTLELTCCSLPWYFLELSGVTTLSLTEVPTGFQQSMEDFLATLKRMQNLRYLDLDDAFATSAGSLSHVASNTFQKVDLPQLCYLFFASSLPAIITLLSCLNIPSQTEIRLQCSRKHDSSLNDYAELSTLLSQRFHISDTQAPSIPMVRSLIVESFVRGPTTITFSASEHDLSASEEPAAWGSNIPLQITFHTRLSMENDHRARIVSDICCSVPLTHVQSVHAVNPLSSAFWSKMLAQLQGLRYLKLSQGYMPDLGTLLSPTSHRDATDQGGCYGDRAPDRVLVPALEELELDDLVISRRSESDMQYIPCMTSLRNSLSSRKESRGQLTIIRCTIPGYDDCHEAVGPEVVDMVGRWGDGRFDVVKYASRPFESLLTQGSASDSDSLEDS